MFIKVKDGSYINTQSVVKVGVDTDISGDWCVFIYTTDKRRFSVPHEGLPSEDKHTAKRALEDVMRGIENG